MVDGTRGVAGQRRALASRWLAASAIMTVAVVSTHDHHAAAAMAQCPNSTFEMQGPLPLSGGPGPIFCVCPANFVCEGCGRLCKNTRFRDGDRESTPPVRCAQGMYRGSVVARTARCTPSGTAVGDGRWGGVRVQPHACGLEDATPYSPAVNGTFVFTISNGHAGTKFLGSRATWERYLPEGVEFPASVLPEFERFPQNLAVQQVGIHSNFCPIGRLYLQSIWWRQKEVTKVLSPAGGGVRTWFDSGHLASFLLSQLVDVLGPRRLGLVRLRRKRLDIAYSKLISVRSEGLAEVEDDVGVGPCAQACVWCLCPFDAATVCLPPGAAWSRMTPFMRFLWEVDELECIWKTVLEQTPSLKTIEVNWSDKITTADLGEIAAFLGIPFAPPTVTEELTHPTHDTNRNQHVQGSHRASKNVTDLERQDREYRVMLGPTKCDDYACTWW